MSAIHLTIAKATPSGNEMLRKHWAVRKRDQNTFAALLLGQIRQQSATKATGRRRVTIERHGRKTLDTDNGFAGCKGLIDSLVKFGLIIDDKPEHCELVFVQQKLTANTKPHTVILLEDCA